MGANTCSHGQTQAALCWRWWANAGGDGRMSDEEERDGLQRGNQLAGNLYYPHFEASTNGIYCGKSNQSKFGHVSDSIERVKTPHSCTRDKPPAPPCPDKAHSRTT